MKRPIRKASLLAAALVAAGFWLGAAWRGDGVADRLDPAARADAKPKPGSARHSVVVDVARRLSPGVVTVGGTVLMRDPMTSSFFDEFFPRFNQGAVRQGYLPYIGSGFIVDAASIAPEAAQGAKPAHDFRYYVLTNYHVVENAEKVTVTLTDGRTFETQLLDADAVVDVALLGIDPGDGKTLPSVPLGDSDDIMIGESVVALGNPFGPIIADPHPTVTIGVISALNRSFQPDVSQRSGPRIYENMIQTDASVNPGNSGGPLANFDGEVIGINTFIISPGGRDRAGSAGVNFSIPINRAAKVAREIIQHGKVRSLYIDFDAIGVAGLSRYVRRQYNIVEEGGALIRHMAARGPAADAGLRLGDIIMEINGKPIGTADDLLAAFYSRTVGERLKLLVSRDGRRFEADYVIQEGRAQQ